MASRWAPHQESLYQPRRGASQPSSPASRVDFLCDNGFKFTDRFVTKDRKLSGKNTFDVASSAMQAAHYFAPPPTSKRNGGTLQRAYQRVTVTDELRQGSRHRDHLLSHLKLHNLFYNEPSTARHHPAAERTANKRPELFIKRVHD